MAIMYPERPAFFTSTAEETVYYALRDQLTDDYYVYYGYVWSEKQDCHVQQEHEADFIVAHPKKGIAVIECKGGLLRSDGGNYYRITSKSESEFIKNPVVQARGNAASLERVLAKYLPHGKIFDVGWGLVFPETPVPWGKWLSNIARDQIAYSPDLSNLSGLVKWVLENTVSWEAKRTTKDHFNDLCSSLEAMIAGCWSLPEEIAIGEEKITCQTNLSIRNNLRFLAENQRAVIKGGPGTGKTFLAVEMAKRLAAQGKATLFLCFNKMLADYLAATYPHKNLEFKHFHRLCYEKGRSAGYSWSGGQLVDPDSIQGHKLPHEYFNEVLPDGLETAIHQSHDKYDALIIDETQDFQKRWLDVSQQLLWEPESAPLVFCIDPRQNIWGNKVTLPPGLVSVPLYDNIRNARPIFDVLKKVCPDSQMCAAGPDTGCAEWIGLTDGDKAEILQVLEDLVANLLDQGIDASQIVLLSGVPVRYSVLNGHTSLACIPITGDLKGEGLLTTSLLKFKGLEKPVVILFELDPWFDESVRADYGDMFSRMDLAAIKETLLYVGLSRAKTHLYLVCGNQLASLVISQD